MQKQKQNQNNPAVIPHKQKAFPITEAMKKKALNSVINGADIYSYLIARVLRACEKEGYCSVYKPAKDIPGHLQQPWFGCIITIKGKEWIGKKDLNAD